MLQQVLWADLLLGFLTKTRKTESPRTRLARLASDDHLAPTPTPDPTRLALLKDALKGCRDSPTLLGKIAHIGEAARDQLWRQEREQSSLRVLRAAAQANERFREHAAFVLEYFERCADLFRYGFPGYPEDPSADDIAGDLAFMGVTSARVCDAVVTLKTILTVLPRTTRDDLPPPRRRGPAMHRYRRERRGPQSVKVIRKEADRALRGLHLGPSQRTLLLQAFGVTPPD